MFIYIAFRKENQKLQVDPSFAPTLHIPSFCAVLLTCYLLNIVIVVCNTVDSEWYMLRVAFFFAMNAEEVTQNAIDLHMICAVSSLTCM